MYIRRVPRHMFVCSAHILAVSIHYSTCRTTPLWLFCKHRGSATQTRCCASSTGCRFVTESTTSWLWWLTRSTAPVYLHTCVINPRESTHEHYVHLTLYCSPYHLPGLSSRSVLSDAQLHLELTTFIHHQHRLSGDLQISVENLFFSVYLSTVAYTSDLITFPPAPLKLPYGAI